MTHKELMTKSNKVLKQGREAIATLDRALNKDDKLYPETQYSGTNGHDVYKRLWPDGDPERLPLKPSLKLRNHSPTGFSWGYSGSGPAQLALALLLDATSEPDKALSYYQDFKFAIVAGWDFNGSWLIFRSDIINWLKLAEDRRIRINEN